MGGVAGESQMKWFWRISAILVGGFFLYAGALKAWDPIRFAGDIENYHILPWAVSVRLAFYLPWLEIICGLGLIFRRLYPSALVITFVLMLAFSGASVAAKARGIDISCGCFGTAANKLNFSWHLALDVAVLALIFCLLRDVQPIRAINNRHSA